MFLKAISKLKIFLIMEYNTGKRKTKSMYKGLVAITFCIFFLAMISSTISSADFSGTWKFNESKSELGEGRFRGAANQLIVSQSGDDLSIERVSVRSSGEEMRSTEKITLDGKECTNTVFGDRERKSTAMWSDDMKTLTITSVMVFEREGQQITVNTTENWTLSEDGKTLTIDYTSTSPRGERKNKFVYDKE